MRVFTKQHGSFERCFTSKSIVQALECSHSRVAVGILGGLPLTYSGSSSITVHCTLTFHFVLCWALPPKHSFLVSIVQNHSLLSLPSFWGTELFLLALIRMTSLKSFPNSPRLNTLSTMFF